MAAQERRRARDHVAHVQAPPCAWSTRTGLRTASNLEETDIWATQVLMSAEPSDRAFSALAIDPAGNTSEMSVRRKAD
ncbi:MAG TPA: hypothetical protein VNI54_18300 [Thermoanaerobaculia bacterium]|nr:hypothetical protein [Thermoanaerobaculia bacterium]